MHLVKNEGCPATDTSYPKKRLPEMVSYCLTNPAAVIALPVLKWGQSLYNYSFYCENFICFYRGVFPMGDTESYK